MANADGRREYVSCNHNCHDCPTTDRSAQYELLSPTSRTSTSSSSNCEDSSLYLSAKWEVKLIVDSSDMSRWFLFRVFVVTGITLVFCRFSELALLPKKNSIAHVRHGIEW